MAEREYHLFILKCIVVNVPRWLPFASYQLAEPPKLKKKKIVRLWSYICYNKMCDMQGCQNWDPT